VTDNCDDCECEWNLKFTSTPQNASDTGFYDYLTLDVDSGEY